MTESEITRTIICPLLEAAGAVVIPFVASRHQKVGVPDRRVESLRWSGWFEAKLEDNRLSIAQAMFLIGLSERRSPSFVMRYRPSIGQLGIESFDGTILYRGAFHYEAPDKDHRRRRLRGQMLLVNMSDAWKTWTDLHIAMPIYFKAKRAEPLPFESNSNPEMDD